MDTYRAEYRITKQNKVIDCTYVLQATALDRAGRIAKQKLFAEHGWEIQTISSYVGKTTDDGRFYV